MSELEQRAAPPSTTNRSRPAPIDRRSLNAPNLITGSRLVLSFVLFGLIYQGTHWLAAAIVFIVAAATDALDGYLARKYQQVTTLGRILDPFVDKIIICGAFVFLVARPDTGVNAWMVIAVLGREMFVTGLRSFLEQSGHDFSAVWSGKIKMILQCIAVAACLLSMDPDFQAEWLTLTRDVLLWASVIVTIYSGVAYAWRGFAMLSAPAGDDSGEQTS